MFIFNKHKTLKAILRLLWDSSKGIKDWTKDSQGCSLTVSENQGKHQQSSHDLPFCPEGSAMLPAS